MTKATGSVTEWKARFIFCFAVRLTVDEPMISDVEVGQDAKDALALLLLDLFRGLFAFLLFRVGFRSGRLGDGAALTRSG